MKAGARSRVVVPLIAALLGLGGGLAGAYLGARATITTQREQSREDRRADARTQRAKVYTDFLAAANSSAVAVARVASSCKVVRRGRATCNLRGGVAVRAAKARYTFQGALNQVYVYGSARGVLAARDVAKALPPSYVGTRYTFHIQPIDDASFKAAYNAFLDVMCREVSAEPRSTC